MDPAGFENAMTFWKMLSSVCNWIWVNWYISFPIIFLLEGVRQNGKRIERQQDVEKAIRASKEDK